MPSSSSLSSGSSWSTTEESKLKTLVNNWKTKNKEYLKTKSLERQGCPCWVEVAKSMKGRSAASCLGRWMKTVGDSITRGNWTETEDKALLAMFSSKTHNSWSKRAIELGRAFHRGVRRGGAEVCDRYFLLKKNKQAKKDIGATKKVVAGKKKKKK